jgi:hypothetical protein
VLPPIHSIVWDFQITHFISTKNSPSVKTFKKHDLIIRHEKLQLVIANLLFMTIFKYHRNKHGLSLLFNWNPNNKLPRRGVLSRPYNSNRDSIVLSQQFVNII